MEINGKKLQEELIKNLNKRLESLKEKDIKPCLAIVTLGPEISWQAYIKQKIKLAEKLEIETRLINLNPETTNDVVKVVEELNKDKAVNGLIVQRPFPDQIDTEKVIQSISKDKDVDGFLESSDFGVPAWLAVKHILIHITELLNSSKIEKFLSNQSILVAGKGGTAGRPIINGLKELGVSPQIIDSKTEHKDNLLENADIIISAVGKSNAIPVEKLKDKSILIGVGTHSEDGKLKGDFDQEKAKEKEIYFTPTPGGVGPVNLAYLFKNLIEATEKTIKV